MSPKDVSAAAMLGKSLGGLNSVGGESPPGADLATKQAMIASEKRRRRRESHNAVERRRRDNINEKISELATLIPECLLDPNGEYQDSSVPIAGGKGGGADGFCDVATLTMPASLSTATPDDLLFGGAATATSPGANGSAVAKKEEKDGSAEPDEKDGADGAGAVKANKGMILRKSVEYIR